jgi:hypothetical protein
MKEIKFKFCKVMGVPTLWKRNLIKKNREAGKIQVAEVKLWSVKGCGKLYKVKRSEYVKIIKYLLSK